MATIDYALRQAALATLFENEVANQINRAVVALQLLPVVPGDSKNITWDVKFGTATPSGAVIADGADVSTFNNDTKVPAVLDFGTYHDAFSITGKAMAAARAAGNPSQLSNMFGDEFNDSMERLGRAIGDGFYNGTGAVNTIWGLYGTVNAIGNTGVYAGIDSAVQTQWQGNVVNAGSAPLSFDLLRDLRRTTYVASGLKMDLFLTDPVQHQKLGALYGAQRRYVSEVKIRGEVIKLDGGYMVLEFDGIPVIEDAQHPVQKVTGLNTRHARIRFLPDAPDMINGSIGMAALKSTEEEQMGSGNLKLMGRVQPLAKTGDAHKFATYLYPQLQIRRRNAHGYITALAA